MTATPASPAPASPDTYPGKGLGIASIIVAFFFALVGLILAIVAKSQSKKAGVKNTPATVGLVLSIVFLIIQVIVVIALVAGGAALFGGLAAVCADLGPGTHTVDGVTYTCG